MQRFLLEVKHQLQQCASLKHRHAFDEDRYYSDLALTLLERATLKIGYPLTKAQIVSLSLDLKLFDHSLAELPALVNRWLELLRQGVPFAYVIETAYFLDYALYVNPHVMVPRPETEILVQTCLQDPLFADSDLRGVEVGVGSGNIALSLLKKHKTLTLWVSDVFSEVLNVARQNLILHGVDLNRCRFFKSFYDEVLDPFIVSIESTLLDFIISNPPYLAMYPNSPKGEENKDYESEVEWNVMMTEPATALFPPHNVNFFYERIAKDAKKYLKISGKIFLEIPHQRKDSIQKIFHEQGYFTKIIHDLNQFPRVLVAMLEL